MKTSMVVASALAAGVACAALVTLGVREARACAVAPPPGVNIEIADESAVIVWDAARKVEHFIRQARFKTRGAPAPDFGFLVPTPTKPELAEASPALVHRLEREVQPEVIRVVNREFAPTALCLWPWLQTAGSSATPRLGSEVRVLDEVQVAGYDAAVLAATDAGALAGWLKDHGYDSRPALAAWLERYVAQGWIITAFKVTGEATAPVRLTFETDRPFYPYREPADARAADAGAAPPRSLRVFFVGAERVEGTIGDATAWPGELEYAAPIEGAGTSALAESIPALPAGALWLHGFKDRSSPRPGTDEVFFARAADQAQVLPPPVILERTQEVPLPLDVIALLAIGVFFGVRGTRRAAAAKADLKKKDERS